MDISQIILAGVFILFAAFMLPRVIQQVKHSPKAEGNDWMSVILPIIGVVLFVIFLMALV